ncbi:hypothetical protein BX666DRAFT_1945333 [Dichotomocladium elegans]|nr:hypothetical protein BX666DRAFT_1945333 [Dichotomocladium elegans]
MKTRVKLHHNSRVKDNTSRYDVYDMRAPYTIPPSTQQRQQPQQQPSTPPTPPSPATDEVVNITAAASLNRTAHENVRRAYAPNYNEAKGILQAIRLNQREPLSQQCIHRLATYVVQAWEADPSITRVVELVDVINHLISATTLSSQPGLDDNLLRQYCRNPSALPTLCPSVALLIAMRYIDRLKKKYTSIRGAVGCSHRLVVVAYMMATKYIHASLRLVVNEDDDQLRQRQRQPSSSGSSQASNSDDSDPTEALPHTRLSTERSTLNRPFVAAQPPASPPLSPPASPKTQREPSLETSRRALRALRMEIEFLHFLSYDLSCVDPISLVYWVRQINNNDDDDRQYTSADEGDDELTDSDSLN